MQAHHNKSSLSIISCQPNLNRKCYIRRRGWTGTFLQIILTLAAFVSLLFNVILITHKTQYIEDKHTETDNQINSAVANNIPKDLQKNVENLLPLQSGSDVKAGALSGKKIKIEAKSSKMNVYVSIDGLKVYEYSSDDDKGRGLHVIVLNQVTGVIMAKRIFDTYIPKEHEALILFLNLIQEGRIVIFVVKDEASQSLRKAGKNAIKMFGSRFIDNLKWRDTWALISIKRNQWLAESHEKSSSLESWGAPIVIQATVEMLAHEKDCGWGDDIVSIRRKQFCAKYEGYGSVCSCTNPAPINLRGSPLLGSRVANLPIAVVAANRPHYLYRMLRGLLTTPGVDPSMVTVYIDGYYDEPSAVAELFQVSVVEHTPICSKNCRISQHYVRTLRETFEKYPNAEYMIILEEDLDVAKDLMDYFSQLLPVLSSDESVYCISAWNDQGYEHSSNDPSMLYRVETMPGLGWVLKKKLFKEELEPKWPGSNLYWDWDMWMRLDGNRKGRECIIPDVSRTYHFGAKGLNVNSMFQDAYFNKHALNTKTGMKFDVQHIQKDAYDKEMHKMIKKAEVLDHTKNPCSHENFVPEVTGHTYVFYIKQNKPGDYETWMNIARCFKLWDLDVRGFHKKMWRFWINKNRIFVVGTSSPYAIYKPKDVVPIFIPKKKN